MPMRLLMQLIIKQDAKVGLVSAEEVGQAAPATPDRSCEARLHAELLMRCLLKGLQGHRCHLVRPVRRQMQTQWAVAQLS